MKTINAFVALACLATLPAIAADGAKSKVIAFNATVKVEVDAAGKPTKVEAPADLPEAVRSIIEKRVASWQYEPAKFNGQPASAVTFVKVGACALPTPAGDGYAFGMDFKGNGPRLVDAFDRLPPPAYPRDAMIGGGTGVFMVSYTVQADGSTKVKSVDAIGDGGGGRYARTFRSELTKWAEGLRYQPELVNGRAVQTEVSFPVVFELNDMGSVKWRKEYLAELQTRAISSKECVAASAPTGLMPVALDSPVKVTPVPAS